MTGAGLILGVLLAFAPPDDATTAPPPLASRFEAGRDLFDQGHYAEAAEIFSRLHAESGDAALLYPLAQSFRLAGRCAEALTAYQGFGAQAEVLRARAQATGSESRVKRLALDLQNASGRVVEMQACVGRSAAAGARARARADERRQAGDAAGARALLEPVWEQTNDPTVLPELAEVHRQLGDCPKSTALLDLAVTSLGPIEVLEEAGAEGSDVAAAKEALQRARAAKGGPACVPRASAHAEAKSGSGGSLSGTPSVPPIGVVEGGQRPEAAKVTRPRWPLWVAGGGGAAVLGGVAFLVLAHRTESDVETKIRTQVWSEDVSRDVSRLRSRGNFYDRAGLALSIGGCVIAGGAMAYYYLVAGKGGDRGVPTVQVSRDAASLLWTGRF